MRFILLLSVAVVVLTFLIVKIVDGIVAVVDRRQLAGAELEREVLRQRMRREAEDRKQRDEQRAREIAPTFFLN